MIVANIEPAHADSALIYFAQNGTYLGPKAGTNPDPVTGAVGFNENATLPFQVRQRASPHLICYLYLLRFTCSPERRTVSAS